MLFRFLVTSFLIFVNLNFLFVGYFLPQDSLVKYLNFDHNENEMIDIVEKCIERGISIDDHGDFLDFPLDLYTNVTALHIAVLKNYLKFACFLIEKGADINAKDCNNNSPIHFACYTKSLEFMKIFLNCSNVNLALKNNNNQSVIDLMNDNFNLSEKIILDGLFRRYGINPKLIKGGVPPLPKVNDAPNINTSPRNKLANDYHFKRKTNKNSIPYEGRMDIEINPFTPAGPSGAMLGKSNSKGKESFMPVQEISGKLQLKVDPICYIPGTNHHELGKNR